MIAESFSEKKAIFEEAEARVKAMAQEGQQAQMANQQQMQQAQLQQQIELAAADREDKQAHDAEMIVLQGDTDIRVKKSEMSDQLTLNAHKIETESINNTNI